MNKAVGFAVFAMLFASQLFCKERSFPAVKRVVALTELTSDMTKELFVGMHPDIAIQCDEGTTLPVQFLYNLKFFSATFAPQLSVKVEKPFYLRFTKGKVFISQDLLYWEKMSNLANGMPEVKVGMSEDKTYVKVEIDMLSE